VVLNSSPLARTIPEKTKNRVRAAAKKLGYSPNPFALSLFNRRSVTVAILLSDLTDPYCMSVLKGIDTSLHRSNYLPVLLDSENSRTKFKRNLQKLVDRRVEGIIGVANSALLESELLTTIQKHRDMEGTAISSVSIENESGTHLAMKHLYDLGHRSIAFLKGPGDIVDSAQRWEGVVRFSGEVGFKIDPKLTAELKLSGSSYEEGFLAAQELLRRNRKFTALLAFDDMTAFGAIRALTQAGKNVPADCSVVGFDDVTIATFYNPPLTTIRQPMEVLGASAVEIFFELSSAFFEKRAMAPIHRKIQPKLVARESTAPFRSR
jgi:LacI family transcriptional regulator